MASKARRRAAALVVAAIDDWCVRYMEGQEPKVDVEVRMELEEIKDAFAAVASIEDPKFPEGWTPGNPRVEPCRCEACETKRRSDAG